MPFYEMAGVSLKQRGVFLQYRAVPAIFRCSFCKKTLFCGRGECMMTKENMSSGTAQGAHAPAKKLRVIAGVMFALLTLCLVMTVPVGAEDVIYYVSTQGSGSSTTSGTYGSLTDTLTTLSSISTGTYIVKLQGGDYTSSYNIVRSNSNVIIKLVPEGDAFSVNFTGTINIYNTGGLDTGGVIFENILFTLEGDKDVAICVPTYATGTTSKSTPGNITVTNCKFIGTYDKGHTQNGIISRSNSQTGNLVVTGTIFDKVSHPISGYYGCAKIIEVSGCTITNAKSAISFNNHATTGATIIVSDNKVEADGFCVRIGADSTAIDYVEISGNSLTVNNPADNDHGAISFRGNTVDDITISENVMIGDLLLNFGAMAPTGSVTGNINLAENYWNGDEAPFAEDSSLVNWGSTVDDEQKPEDDVVIYTELNTDGTINKNPTPPSQPATSTSSGTPTPGAYFNYPRTITDGGLVEFGTSKVVKSVTLPAGSSGKVNLHIDSTAYWPLVLDSEFTFDISVEKLGEGTSYISFKIDESKLTALELTAADVGVYHEVNGEWVKLVVTYTIEDGTVLYTAETDSFSPFKLVIEEGAAVQKEEEVNPSEPVTPPVDTPETPVTPDEPEVLPPVDEPETPEQPEEPASPAPLLAVLAGLGAAVVLRRK